MEFDLAEVFAHMPPIQMAIVGVLAVMAFASISVVVERLWVYWRSRRMSRRFAPEAAKKLQAGDHAGLIKLAESYPASHLAREGWKSTTLKPGDKISVVVFPLRNDEKGGQYISVTLPDGKKLGRAADGVI